MLYHRVNGFYVNANNSNEIVTYINTELKSDYDLDPTAKPKPVAEPNDLLLLLTQHWARDKSVFHTENNRHDMATVMLFQAYTSSRPAKIVHSSKGKASQDPLGDIEEPCKAERAREEAGQDYNKENDVDDSLDYDDDSETGDSPELDGDFFDSDDDAVDNETYEDAGSDSSYRTEETNAATAEDADNHYAASSTSPKSRNSKAITLPSSTSSGRRNSLRIILFSGAKTRGEQ
ncbi:hypothetical protein G7Y89_g4931 [Cudoniella acicularis]|uniref:Uncharacterized protein n=1 Tax=Cudoniella acicularis TaxID=354080 RepID=A0A8H4RRJ6_9HELO|nr:hypothetical protein G7Y89_g4931 [Cudoniella acicularis]